ncbi:methylamine utilization protein [Noviherbaspirillum galbum]|uniref:Methylamine utilization protein n=1 Tax=Noviherbaspirillum galbum TaxID=2709383 RepID=A0A6B3SLW4_9BURK|nr:methylamine utilization protein [Noviherbaspirillum galbum]NEX59646.1 methylamine utilization protein [Noviherbaspirillum galbum]
MNRLTSFLGAALALASSFVHAAALTVQVTDSAGRPLADAAVYAEPASGAVLAKSGKAVDIEQKARKFMPLVTVVQTGSDIAFPNNDTVRHHVYSVSPAKPFDIKLYSGQPASPIHFDKPGTVVIGCNIHDQMLAYVHVVSTPWYAKTDASGVARIDGLPAGKYELKGWHYSLPLNTSLPGQHLNMGAADMTAAVQVNVKTPGAN